MDLRNPNRWSNRLALKLLKIFILDLRPRNINKQSLAKAEDQECCQFLFLVWGVDLYIFFLSSFLDLKAIFTSVFLTCRLELFCLPRLYFVDE